MTKANLYNTTKSKNTCDFYPWNTIGDIGDSQFMDKTIKMYLKHEDE